MKATGLFFLTGRPSLVQLRSPDEGQVQGWAFPMLERTKRGTQHVLGLWKGTDAAIFVQVHHARLKAGLALNLELERITPAKDGLQGFITSCSLAPDRWPKTEVDPTATPSQQPQHAAA
jgi:hypothetical protein